MPQWKIKRREIFKTTMEEQRDEKDSRNNKAEIIYMYISYVYMEYLQKTLTKKKTPEICNIRNCNKM